MTIGFLHSILVYFVFLLCGGRLFSPVTGKCFYNILLTRSVCIGAGACVIRYFVYVTQQLWNSACCKTQNKLHMAYVHIYNSMFLSFRALRKSIFWCTYKEYFSFFDKSIVLTMLKSILKTECKVQDAIVFLEHLKRVFWSFYHTRVRMCLLIY